MKFYTSTNEIPEEMLKGIDLTYPQLTYLPETGILYDNTYNEKQFQLFQVEEVVMNRPM